MSENRIGRLDLLAQEGLGQLADLLGKRIGIGLRGFAQPAIDRFVSQNVTRHKLPVTGEQIAERLGVIRKERKGVR